MESPNHDALSGRLRQVLELAAEGLTDKEIANRLGIQPQTVESHWKRLRQVYSTSSRAHIVAKALEARHRNELDDIERERDLLLLETAERRRTQEELTRVLKERNALLAEIRYRKSANERARDERLERLERMEEAVEKSGVIVSRGIFGDAWTKLFMTRNFEQTGYALEDVLEGRLSPADFIEPSDLGELVARLEAGIPQGIDDYEIEYRFKHADGRPGSFREWIRLERNEAGVPTHYTGVAIMIPTAAGTPQ